jgi:hypothetical protein
MGNVEWSVLARAAGTVLAEQIAQRRPVITGYSSGRGNGAGASTESFRARRGHGSTVSTGVHVSQGGVQKRRCGERVMTPDPSQALRMHMAH